VRQGRDRPRNSPDLPLGLQSAKFLADNEMATSGSIEIPLAAEWAQLRRERSALRDCIARLDDERGRVSEAVLERVRADYLRRLADLDSRAEDLAARARQEQAALARAVDRQEEGVQRLRFELEELDLRERIGEPLDPPTARRAAELRRELQSLEEDLAALVELRRGVTDVAELRSSGHVVAPDPPPAPPARSGGFAAALDEAVSAVELLPPIPPLTNRYDSGDYRPPAAPPAAPRSPLGSDPRLEAPESPGGADAVRLAGATIVGRTPEAGLRLPVGTVSRRHAELTPTAEGWVVRDLHSENGTWVNGERVWERRLADGDRVQFGSVALIFRLD
jgi:hypothetical protein